MLIFLFSASPNCLSASLYFSFVSSSQSSFSILISYLIVPLCLLITSEFSVYKLVFINLFWQLLEHYIRFINASCFATSGLTFLSGSLICIFFSAIYGFTYLMPVFIVVPFDSLLNFCWLFFLFIFFDGTAGPLEFFRGPPVI